MKSVLDPAGCGRSLALVVLGLFPLCVIMSASQIYDHDVWWHLNLGRQIWQSATPIVPDTFSYTFTGAPQVNSEWFADLILYGAFAGGGWVGIFLLQTSALLLLTGLLAGAFFELHRRCDRAALLALFAGELLLLFAIRFRLFPRPFLFSYLGVAALLWLLLRHRRSGDEGLLWGVPLLTLLWANLSVGVFFAPLILALYLIGSLGEKRWDWRWSGIFLVALVATLANPDGYTLYTYLFDRIVHARGSIIMENLPLSAQILWDWGWHYTAPYQFLVILAAVALVFVCRGRPLFLWLLIPVCFVFSLRQVRMIDFFCIVAILPVCQLLERLASRLPLTGGRGRVLAVAVVLFLLGAGCAVALRDGSYLRGFGFREMSMPRGAAAFLDEQGIDGPLFNSYHYGGYLAWAEPTRRVFFDGRNDHLYSAAFFDDYFTMVQDAAAWAVAEARWGFEIAVLEYDRSTADRHFPRHLTSNPAWALVYWDDHSAVYLKRVPRFAALIERYGYRLARPNFNNFTYVGEATTRQPSAQVLALLRSDSERNVANQEPRLALVYLMYSLNRQFFAKDIRRQLEICLTLPPDLAREHSVLGVIHYDSGRRDEAVRAARAALAIDPGDKGGLFLKEKLGF